LSLFFQANFYLNLKILSVKGRYSIIFLSVFLSVSSGMLSLFFLRDMLGVYIVAVSFFILNFVGSMTLMMIERNFERHMLFVFLGVFFLALYYFKGFH
ncbi:hypothetical protein VBR34_17500, partial [Klebsiella pneumoniae]|nr:hypothetical protein [Klebsiella pneumoniae]